MKFAKVYAAQPEYLRGRIVSVEIDIARGLHLFSIVGMASRAVDEARDRVGSAIKNSGFESPKSKNEKLVVSLAPADLKKEGAYYDVAIAIGYLLATGDIKTETEGRVFIGELSLDGKVRPLLGILPIVQAAKEEGITEIFVPKKNAKEAALVEGITIYPIESLRELVRHLDSNRDDYALIAPQKPTIIKNKKIKHITDFSDIRGQAIAKRGLEIAAAGGHNVCMFGPPGTGKTMLARAFTSILPSLSRDQMLEVTAIHSISGSVENIELMYEPPLRTPHHTSSYVAIVGGGTNPRPGEITLAHRGVLFLDEFPEFDKKVLESLRQPLEDNIVTVSRAKGTVTFPANVIVVAAMNPCPCGYYGSSHSTCICSAFDISRYKKKISGPIIDRIDIWLPVEHIEYGELMKSNNEDTSSEDSQTIALRVREARKRQHSRYHAQESASYLNSELSSRKIQELNLSLKILEVLNESAEKMRLSPRSYHRVIKIARTIADLEASDEIYLDHILEALQYRPQ